MPDDLRTLTDLLDRHKGSPAAHAHEAAPALAATSAAEPDGGRIWTPDSDRPAGGKSALWTPS